MPPLLELLLEYPAGGLPFESNSSLELAHKRQRGKSDGDLVDTMEQAWWGDGFQAAGLAQDATMRAYYGSPAALTNSDLFRTTGERIFHALQQMQQGKP